MSSTLKLASVGILLFLIISCEQKISYKQGSLTSINTLSYTDVIYKSLSDTVLVSTFDGRIIEIINLDTITINRPIINLEDEIYSIAYNDDLNQIYATTLNKGVVIIDEEEAKVEAYLKVKSKWIPDLYFHHENNILAGTDYDKNIYLWDLKNNNELLPVSSEMKGLQPGAMTDGFIYFDGNGIIKIWSLAEDTSSTYSMVGVLKDANSESEVLSISYNRFILKDLIKDSLLLDKKHPNWPIYVESKDTTVMVPVSLPLTDALLSNRYIFTSSIDRSVRKWDKTSGKLIDNLIGHNATVSAIAISPNESQLASVDLKGGLKFWKIENEK